MQILIISTCKIYRGYILIKNCIPLIFVNTRILINLLKRFNITNIKVTLVEIWIYKSIFENKNSAECSSVEYKYNGKIFRQIWKKYSERKDFVLHFSFRLVSIYLFIYLFFLIDSYLRIFHATRLKRQRDHFNDISHAFHTESNTILIKHRKLSDERNKSRVMAC